jgi:hypothetical protein
MGCCERGNEHTGGKHKYILDKILRFYVFKDVVHIFTIALYPKIYIPLMCLSYSNAHKIQGDQKSVCT